MGVAITCWREGEGGGFGSHFLTGVAVDAVTRHADKAFNQRGAINPVGEEGADHRIAHFEFADVGADCDDFPRAVSHRNTFFARPPHATDNGKIVVVERVGVQAHRDFVTCRLAHVTAADNHVVIAATRLDEDGFIAHGASSYFLITQNNEMNG